MGELEGDFDLKKRVESIVKAVESQEAEGPLTAPEYARRVYAG